MAFDPSDDDAWWPNPWPPRNGPVGSTSYPGDWTDPFINSRAATLNPFASAPAPFSAAQLGAMAWHPPIFPGGWPTFVPNKFPAAVWPPQPIPPAVPTITDLSTVPGWPFPQSILAQLAQFVSPAARPSIDNAGGLFSRDPSIPVGGGLFPYPLGSDPDPTSPFGSGFVSTGGGATPSRTLGMPGISSTPGWPAPFAQLQDSFAVGGPAFDLSNSLPARPPDAPPPAPPIRSVLFNQSPAAPATGVTDRDQADLDQTAQNLAVDGLPMSKSGRPLAPSPPVLSTAREQALYASRLLAPNLVAYFNDPLPPPPPFPATPGKIPSEDNPYALGAAFEAASSLPLGLEGAIARPLGRAAAGAAEKAVIAPILDRAALLRLNAELGRLGEEAVGIPANAPKPSIKISESGVTRYPDRLTEATIEEVKNVKYLAFTQQLRDYLAHAQNNDLTFILHARPETTYSGTLQQLIDAGQIRLRYIPRPSK